MRQLTALQPFGIAERPVGVRLHQVELTAQPQFYPAHHRQGSEI